MTTWCDLGHHQRRTIRRSQGNTKALRTWLQLMMWKEQLVLIWAEICSSYFSEATLCIRIVNHSKSLQFSEYGRVLRVKQVCVILPMELFSRMSHNSIPCCQEMSPLKDDFEPEEEIFMIPTFHPLLPKPHPLWLVSGYLHTMGLDPWCYLRKLISRTTWWKPHYKSSLDNIRPRVRISPCSL